MTKHGNPRLRSARIETAWRLVRFQPHDRAVLKWRHLLGKGALATGAARKKAIVALAPPSSPSTSGACAPAGSSPRPSA